MDVRLKYQYTYLVPGKDEWNIPLLYIIYDILYQVPGSIAHRNPGTKSRSSRLSTATSYVPGTWYAPHYLYIKCTTAVVLQ